MGEKTKKETWKREHEEKKGAKEREKSEKGHRSLLMPSVPLPPLLSEGLWESSQPLTFLIVCTYILCIFLSGRMFLTGSGGRREAQAKRDAKGLEEKKEIEAMCPNQRTIV